MVASACVIAVLHTSSPLPKIAVGNDFVPFIVEAVEEVGMWTTCRCTAAGIVPLF